MHALRVRTIVCALFVCLFPMYGSLASAAQDGSPVASPPAGLTIPDPADCTVEPRPVSFFEELIANPPAVPADADQRFSKPSETPRPWSMPEGAPADAATVDAVTATLHQALACLNANDPLRFLALFSDDMVRLFFALQPIPAEALPSLAATPVASPPDLWLGYAGVIDARVLPDGRVAALASDYDPTEPPYGVATDFAIFVNVDGQWLIDSLIENVVIVEGATPAA